MKSNSTRATRKQLPKVIKFAVIALSVVTVPLTIFQFIGEPALANYEEPDYKVILSSKEFEVRKYGKKLAAEVEVKGDQRSAMNKGFRILASYIFGQNVPKDKIAMTSPVVAASSTKIAMTSPVIVESSQNIDMTSPVSVEGSDNKWKITFFMPSKFDLETIPEPLDERISLSEIPVETYAVKKFSGRWSKNNFDQHRAELINLLEKNNIKVTGEPVNAYYDPPFTLPMFRRNEVMVPVVVDKNSTKLNSEPENQRVKSN